MRYRIREADGVELVSVVDNSVELDSTTGKKEVSSLRQWTKRRYGQEWMETHAELPSAEHGFSMLVRILSEGKSHTILFDTGTSSEGVVENSARMGLKLNEIECIVLSHGHYDHSGGLLRLLKIINKVDMPVIVHNEMFKKRGVANQDGTVRPNPEFPAREHICPAQLISTQEPTLIADGFVLVTGEIPRRTSYEKGFLTHRVLVDGSWQPDPWIRDDRAIVIKVKGKGLVIIAGCAHSGIINTINYSKEIAGSKNIYAVIGGFHLAGKTNEDRIDQSVEELEKMNPHLIAPSHCTGWKAKCAIAKKMPDAFVWNSVGNLYSL